ncbi:MAG: hypothetical protein P4L45_04360 [Ignavibacteriaceae bacterium]|nr:hypothetical protein [Ignavibacteriaceae bacterium]
MSKEEVLTILSLEEYNGIGNANDIDIIYERYLDQVSYKPNDLIAGIGNSILSGFSLGAEESKEFKFTHSGWLPAFLQDWYNSPPYKNGNFLYQFVSWQEVWHEVDYVTDRNAYEMLKQYFRGKWYFALLVHWLFKNVSATVVRDKFKYDDFSYSFKLDLFLTISK